MSLRPTPPLVTVAICSYNRAELLPEAVESVLSQTFRDFELLICDDASTDQTAALCDAWAARDARVRVLRHPANVGMAQNWRSAVEHAKGVWFAKLDDDNRYLDTFLEKLTAAVVTTSHASLAFCDEWVIAHDGVRRPMRSDQASQMYGRSRLTAGEQPNVAELAAKQSFSINATLIRREALERAGKFEPWAGAAADTLLFLRLAALGAIATYVAERLAEYRVHDGQTSTDLISNLGKAEASVRLWQSCRFAGLAERLRRVKLRQALLSLARLHLIKGDFRAARAVTLRSISTTPFSPRPWIGLMAACLPRSLLSRALRFRYGTPRESA